MKKVFASDFDGTLYFYKAKDKLPEASVKKIREFQEKGHLFGLCTGRQVGGLTPFIEGKFQPDFYITSTGANIVNGNLEEIYKRGIDPVAADGIIRFAGTDKHWITLDVEGEICVFAEMDFPGKYHVITGVEDCPKGLIHQIGIHTESLSEAAELSAKINREFGKFVNAFQNVIEVDIAPKGCTKGMGVNIFKERMESEMGTCKLYGIGDSINDLPLLEAADVSYTFPYAPDEVKAKATKIVETIVDALEDCMQDGE